MKKVIGILCGVIVAFAMINATVSVAKDAPKLITIKGSDTMVQLVSSWSEEFMNKYPDADISVTGGGSGTGIAAIINGTTDICASSRNIGEKEKKLAEQKKITTKEITVAKDGIAVIVNASNPINEITIEQLGKIYTGEITNWKQAGGKDGNIILLSRESNSGTYVFFQEHVLNKKDYSQKARLIPATAAIIESVSSDKLAIGYVGLGYALEAKGKVKILAVKANATAPAIVPSEKFVKSGEYSIARSLYFYTNGEPKGAVKQFIDFCLSKDGQKIVRDTGYITIE